MTNTSNPYNSNAGTPDLRDALEFVKKEILLSLNCHHIGTIQEFDEEMQTAVVSINYQKTYVVVDPKSQRPVQQLVPYPINIDCPVIFLGGGIAALTFPVKQGDECLVLFNDRDLNNWFDGQPTLPPKTPRLHSYSDALVLVGIRSASNVLPNYDTTRATLRGNLQGTTVVAVGETLVKIANITTSLGTILTHLDSALTTFATALAGATDPTVVAAGAALDTAITAVQVLVTELLE